MIELVLYRRHGGLEENNVNTESLIDGKENYLKFVDNNLRCAKAF
jgi:hypothetical protein